MYIISKNNTSKQRGNNICNYLGLFFGKQTSGEGKDFFEYYIEQKDVQLCELGRRLERLGQKSCDNGEGLTMIKRKRKKTGENEGKNVSV